MAVASFFFALIADDLTFKSFAEVGAICLLISSTSSPFLQISLLFALCGGPGVISNNYSYLYHYKAIPSRQAEEKQAHHVLII